MLIFRAKLLKPMTEKRRYRVHRFDIKMSRDQNALEEFLNSLDGEVVSIIPNVHPHFTMGGMGARVSFLYIVEKIA